MFVNVEGLIQTLIEEGYKEEGAGQLAGALAKLEGPFSRALTQLILDGDIDPKLIPTLSSNGVTFEQLTEAKNMNPWAALATLDWLERDPDEALASLQRGSDFVIGS